MPDINTVMLVRSLSKKQRRARKMRREKRSLENFTEQLKERNEKAEKQKKINDLIQQIIAYQILGIETLPKRMELCNLLKK